MFLVEASCHWRILVRIDLAALVLIAGAKLTKTRLRELMAAER